MNSYRVAKSSCVTSSNTALTKIFSETRHDQIIAVICIFSSDQELIMKTFSLIQQYFLWGHLYVSPVCLYKKKCSAFSWKMSNHDNCLLLFFFFYSLFLKKKKKKGKKKLGTCTKFVQLLLKMSKAVVFILFLFALTHVLLLWWWGGKRYEMSKLSHAVCGLDQK